MIEHSEGNIVMIDTDDMLVCGYCGIEEAMTLGVEEFNDNYDLDAIYDELYDDLKSQMLVWLDGDYECDLTDEDYYFVEETKEKKDND